MIKKHNVYVCVCAQVIIIFKGNKIGKWKQWNRRILKVTMQDSIQMNLYLFLSK